jgi:hypothetical protein
VHSKDGRSFEDKIKKVKWMWVTNLTCSFSLAGLKNTVSVCYSQWQIENQCSGETVNTWKADHIYRHSANAIIAFLLLLFICVNIFNIFKLRNIKDRSINTKIYLIKLIGRGFNTNAIAFRLAPAIPPIPI